ncbi:MAG: transcriptional regulator [Burkholderiales bacterium PBB3]|nr:MAG: transcriptional regulator [Burkholderiales bacterium PBB3]
MRPVLPIADPPVTEDSVFGTFTLQRHERRLLRDGQPVLVGARAFDVLCVLVENSGQLVTKNALLNAVWPGLVVEENNLQVHVSSLRRILGSNAISTVPSRGYRFTLRVAAAQAAPPTDGKPADAQRLPNSRASDLRTYRRTIAVLPFANLNNDPDQEYFSDGLAEDIISHLTRSPWLLVVSRNSSFTFRDTQESSQTIGKALGSRYLVQGSVRKAGTTLRMTAELIDTLTKETLWSDRFDRPLTDMFALQAEISHQIVSAIEPVYLHREERVATELAAQDLQHWDLLMRARWHFWRTTPEHILKSVAYLNQALELKPNDSPSLALLAFTHLAQLWGAWAKDPRAVVAEANRLALVAVRNDERDAFAHFTLGTALSCAGQMDAAIAELECALGLYPQAAAAAGELGRLLVFSGRTEEAEEFILQAIDASPHDPHLSLWIRSRAIACFIEERYGDAVRYAREATAKRPDWYFNHLLMSACLSAAGDVEGGRTSLATALSGRGYTLQSFQFGHPFVQRAHRDKFLTALSNAGWEP